MIITENIINLLKQSITKNNRFNKSKFLKIKTDEIDDILLKYNISPTGLYILWKKGFTDIPKCPQCGKNLTNFNHKYCSITCLNKSDEHKKKIEKTYLEKYGVRSNLMVPDIKEKIKKTNLEKYGVEYIGQSTEIKNKIKTTNLEKYGQTTPLLNEDIKEKIRETNLDKYGVEHYSQSNEYNEKIKKTCQEKYGEGITNVFQVESVKEKIRETNLDKYGVENPQQCKEIKKKSEQTNIEKYGCENVFQNEEIKERIKKNNLEKYGVEHYSQLDTCKEKAKSTNLEKYGQTTPLQNEEIKEKIKKTNLERYGVENPQQCKEIKDKSISTHRKFYYNTLKEKLSLKKIDLVTTYNEYVNLNQIICKCQLCDTVFEAQNSNPLSIYCKNCSVSGFSIEEKSIVSFIKTFYSGEIIENSRKVITPYELDIYIPEKKLAIEFNGNYWHSTEFKDIYYHQNKSLECFNKGIRLIHIYETEYITNKENVLSFIKNIILDNKEETYYINDIEYVDLNKGFTRKQLGKIYKPKLIETETNSYYDAGYAEVING